MSIRKQRLDFISVPGRIRNIRDCSEHDTDLAAAVEVVVAPVGILDPFVETHVFELIQRRNPLL